MVAYVLDLKQKNIKNKTIQKQYKLDQAKTGMIVHIKTTYKLANSYHG